MEEVEKEKSVQDDQEVLGEIPEQSVLRKSAELPPVQNVQVEEQKLPKIVEMIPEPEFKTRLKQVYLEIE